MKDAVRMKNNGMVGFRMSRMVMRKSLFSLALLSSTYLGIGQVVAQPIVVEGNRRIESDAVRAYFTPRQGDSLTQSSVDEGVRSLMATGLFSDVRVAQRGGRLVVTVVENSVVNHVSFEGNSKIKKESLESEVQSKARGPFSQAIVQSDVQRITEVYRRSGRYDVKVSADTVNQSNGRVDVIFKINEGDKTKIKSISFVGNNAYSDTRLRDVIATTESNWLSWLKSTDVYDPDRLEADKELIRRFYLKQGYADVRVVSAVADYDRDKNAFFITFTVEEGERYRFGDIDVQSNIPDINAAQLRNRIRTSAGSTYNAELVEKSIEDITIEVSKRGYAFAQVRPRGSRNIEERTIGLVYVVEEGPRVYVERINVRGNTRTRDYVIRREFDLAEGDPYNRVLIDRAERRLKNLNYFKNVRITNEPGSAPDRVILNVDVEDQPTGEFSVAGGYSTSDGFIGEVSLGERNFLGRGQIARVSAQWGERSRGYEVSFTEPYFMGYRVAAGVDFFGRETDDSRYNSFSNRLTGGTLRFGFALSEEVNLLLRYSGYNQEITIPAVFKDNNLSNGEASYALKQAAGSAFVSQVGYTLSYNSLDNINRPTSGFYAELKQDFAGLGGDVNFIRTTGEARAYYEVYSDVVAMLKGQAGNVTGWGGKDLRLIDGFFLGPTLVRGFAPSGLTPRDLLTSNRDAVGGTTYWGVTAELQFPFFGLPKDFGMRGAVFADAGSVFGVGDTAKDLQRRGLISVADSESVRSSVGAGLIWSSPFGPLRFDYAIALSKEPYDRTQAFRFSGGTRF